MTLKQILAPLAVGLFAAVIVAGCGRDIASAAHGGDRAAASSAMANPTISAYTTALENELLANLKAHFSPAHPVKSVEAAVHATFPKGDTARIEAYAVQKFTPAVLTTSGPGSARQAWAAEVAAYAIGHGAVIPSASPAASPAATASPAPPASSS
jgi:hypothetical protein